MERPEQIIRIHRFLDLIGFSTENTTNLYFTVDDAEKIATELRQFTRCIRKGAGFHPATRIINKGKAHNESNGKAKAYMIP